jgi:ketosteroid isomerase-like protein
MTTSLEIPSVQKTVDRRIAGYAQSDVEIILGCYEKEAAYALEGLETATGEALRSIFDGDIATNPQFLFGSHEVMATGDLALHISAYDVAIPSGMHRGILAVVLRRQADGEWLIVLYHPEANRVLTNVTDQV